jgi:hypothetical protein
VCSQTPRPRQSSTDKKIVDARNGAILQMVEAATLGAHLVRGHAPAASIAHGVGPLPVGAGMPLEVWKTHLGRYRNETTFEVPHARGAPSCTRA